MYYSKLESQRRELNNSDEDGSHERKLDKPK
jgi:hypothetical protein